MSLFVSDFLNGRIEYVMQNLCKTNGDYALAMKKKKMLYQNIEPIIQRRGELNITAGDCMDFCEYFENDFTTAAILQQALYRQGYLDCAQLLAMLLGKGE